MSAIEARYAGECADRGGRINVGDPIRSGDWQEEVGPAAWCHATCPDDDTLEPATSACPDCHLTHQGECF